MGAHDYLQLRLLSEMYWDFTEFKKSCDNKIRSGHVHADVTETAKVLEHEQSRLERAMVAELKRCAPAQITDWVISTPGVGLPGIAKLLGLTGDPYMAYPLRVTWAEADDRKVKTVTELDPYVRNVDKFWAYCGVGDPARKRVKGMDQAAAMGLGNPKAKATIYVIAKLGSVMNPAAHYRPVYDAARKEYATRVHVAECRNKSRISPNGCGTQAHPEWGAPGSSWRPGHQNAAAIRKVCKEILRDLWEAARDAHS